MNRGYGPQIGGTVSIPIYQAGAISRQIASAKLSLQSAQYDLESGKQLAYTQTRNALDEFENQRRLLAIEKDTPPLPRKTSTFPWNVCGSGNPRLWSLGRPRKAMLTPAPGSSPSNTI